VGSLETDFARAAGRPEGKVEVDISYEIIRQFSMQLYTNPRKAIEELVCNSYDAGADECYVKTPMNQGDFLAVIDNGESMDCNGLQDLWKIAVSPKTDLGVDRIDNGRQQIGKFGVGKLAAFSLGKRLTHIAMKNGEVRIVSVSSGEIRDQEGGGKPAFEIHKLSEKDARPVLEPYLVGLPKPWEKEWESWTLAVVSEIDEETAGRALKIGFLRRMITHALPLSSRFEVSLDGMAVEKRQLKKKDVIVRIEVTDKKFLDHLGIVLQHYWRERLQIESTSEVPENLFKCTTAKMPNPQNVDEKIHVLVVPKLGPVFGNAVMTRKTLTTEKLTERGYRDNGFAIYVRGRQVNPEDELFGITQRSHMYWRRFRAEVEIPALDGILLVQRNSVSENKDEVSITREVLRTLFEESRKQAEAIEEVGEYEPEPFGSRLRTLSPIVSSYALRGLAKEKYPEGGIESVGVEFATIGDSEPPAVYDSDSGSILINDEHPIMAALDEQGKAGRQLKHVLGEAIAGFLMAGGYLRARGVDEGLVAEAEDIIDDALRSAAGFVVDEVERHIQELEEASFEGRKPFEKAIVMAFRDFRLSTTLHGKSGETDAVLVIPQAATKNMMIAVEAKGSKGPVTHEDVSAATVNRHMQDQKCTNAFVVAREFQTKGKGEEDSALVKEMRGKFPLITTSSIGTMLRLHSSRPFTHEKVKDILTTWKHPNEQEGFIREVWKSLPDSGLMREVLTIAWERQKVDDKNFPEPGIILADPRIMKRGLSRPDIVKIIEAMQIATQMIMVHDKNTHEFEMLAPPDTIFDALTKLPEEH